MPPPKDKSTKFEITPKMFEDIRWANNKGYDVFSNIDSSKAREIFDYAVEHQDTSTRNILINKYGFIPLDKPPPKFEISSGLVENNLIPFQQYTQQNIINLARTSGTGPVEGFFPHRQAKGDWAEEAAHHLQINPNSEFYKDFGSKNILPSNRAMLQKLMIAFGNPNPTAPTNVISSDRKTYGKFKEEPYNSISLTIPGTKKIVEVPLKDIVLNQEQFFRKFSGLGAPKKEGNIRISPRSISWTGATVPLSEYLTNEDIPWYGTTEEHSRPPYTDVATTGRKFITKKRDDGSLYWSPFEHDKSKGRFTGAATALGKDIKSFLKGLSRDTGLNN